MAPISSFGGDDYAEALAASEAWAQQTGAMQVRAFDQNETIIGQGTLALEFEAQAPDIDTVLVSVGGGGLIAGIAAWYAGRIKVIGVEPLASPTLTRALEAGHPVDAEAGGLAADSLAPRRVGERVFPIAQKYAPRTVLVTDEAIAEAQRTLWRALRIVAEPGGACAFSAISSGAYRPAAGERVAVVISGGNTTAVEFRRPALRPDRLRGGATPLRACVASSRRATAQFLLESICLNASATGSPILQAHWI